MPSWDPSQYLHFAEERTRPARDLAVQIRAERVSRVIDLGCGPGNSTSVLAVLYSQARITGLDNSPDMIEQARRLYPSIAWQTGDIAAWADEEGETFDVVYSNAALQWVPDHESLFPKLMQRVSPGGALALQMPANFDCDAQQAMRRLAASAAWQSSFADGAVRNWASLKPEAYYAVLAPQAAALNIWTTEYLHILDGVEGIVEWYKGTGLRPYLAVLKTDEQREAFLRDYKALLADLYRKEKDGRVIFPFRRLFIIAYTKGTAVPRP